MKNVSPALAAFLPTNRQFVEADLITIAPGSPQNWLRWSMDPTKSSFGLTLVAGTNNTPDVLDPQSGSTACKLLASGGSLADGIALDQQIGCPSNSPTSTANAASLMGANVVTYSVWLRTLSASSSALALYIRCTNNAGSNSDVKANVVITSTWKRFFVTRVLQRSQIATQPQFEVFLRGRTPGSGGLTWDNTVPAIYSWGTQVEMRSTPGPYVATQINPRLGNCGPIPEVIRITTIDRDIVWQGNTYLSSSTQNLIPFSEDYENVNADNQCWIANGNGAATPVVTPDFTTGPDGVALADKIAFGVTIGGQTPNLLQQAPASPPFQVAGKTVTVSFWAKTDTTANLTAYTTDTAAVQYGSTVFPLTSVWQRFSITATYSPISVLSQYLVLSSIGPQAAFNLYLYGVQYEINDFARTYVPTFAIPQWGIGKLTRSKLKWGLGLTVDTMDIDYDAPQLSAQIANGYLDAARVVLDRLYGSAFGTWIDSVTLYAGNVADVKELGRTRAKIQTRSRLDLLNNSLPYMVYQPSCRWVLYSPGCTLNKLLFTKLGTISAGTTVFQAVTNLTDAAGYGDLGTITFNTGILAGQSFTIKTFLQPGAAAQIVFVTPLPFLPSVGDRIAMWPGCDHTSATCNGKFSNLINNGGFEFVPVPETAF